MNAKTGMILILAFCLSGPLLAHHAFGSLYDGDRVVRQKGVITLFARLNPHSLIFVDSTDANGVVQHWVLEAQPAVIMGQFKPGGTIEFCGYGTKDGVDAFKSYQSPEPISLSLKSVPRPVYTGKLIAPETVTLGSGEKFVWNWEKKCL